jgi:hypothetical protein
VDFSRDDSRIITTSSDGCVYYWKVGAHTRDQEYVFKNMSVNKIALSKSKAKETHIVAICEAHSEHQTQNVGPAEAMILRRQSTVMQRRSTRQGEALQDLAHAPSVLNMQDYADGGKGASRGHSDYAAQPFRRTYLAIWKDSLTGTTPRVLAMDSEVRCVALGETDGVDKFDICVLGMADGRVLVSSLPLPGYAHKVLHVDSTINISPAVTLPSPLHAGVQSAAQLFQGQARAPSKRTKGGVPAESKRGMLTTHDEQGPGEAATVATAQTGQTSQTGDADSSTASVLHRDRDDMSIHSRQSSVLDGGLDGTGTVPGSHAGSVPGTAQSFREAAATAQTHHDHLDEGRCRQMRMHFGPVSIVTVSRNGLWIFSAGTDGVIHLYATSKRGAEMVEMSYNGDSMESRFHMVEASKLRALRAQLSDTERLIETNKKDYDLKVDKILESKEKMVMDLKQKMQKEIKQRDETIVQSRNEYLKLKTGMNSEIAAIRKQCNDSISDLELSYEQKLAQEGLYLDKMKQAYDEYVVHSRMDLAELQRKTEQRVEAIEADRNTSLLEAEKQKKTVLQYFEYVKLRNEELMQSLVGSQVEER